MGEVDTYIKVPLPDEPKPGDVLSLGPGKWYRWKDSITGWEPIDNPNVEPQWGEPLLRWTPLKKGERVQVTGGDHWVNWLGTAQGEMDDGTESVMIDGKDSPWWFSPKYLVRVQDLTDKEVNAQVRFGMADIPDTDSEHELAAGVFSYKDIDDLEQIVLALPLKRLPVTSATGYIFGDEYRTSKLIDWCMQFIKKQMDYGDGANDLGLEGQYAELHRKITKLRRAMWEGVELVNEPLNEVLMDLVGHCFLAMMYNDNPGLVRYKKGGSK